MKIKKVVIPTAGLATRMFPATKGVPKAMLPIFDKPTLQYKQIKSDISFFGESFLEGFLGFYGFELDNAVSRYESNLQIIETKELGIDDEAKYFLGTSQKGEFKKATSELPSKSIAEEELQKFFSKEKKQVQTQSIELTKDTDE